jgi:hypothetical protein
MSRFRATALQSMDSLFRVFADPAIVTCKDGFELSIYVIPRFPDQITDIFETRVHNASHMFDIKAHDVPTGRVMDIIRVNDRTYKIQGEPVMDQHNLVLKVETYEVESSSAG